MLAIVACEVLPVRIFIACISVVLSCWGRRDWTCALKFVKFIVLCMRVMSPPPKPPALSCRMEVKL